MVTRSAALFRIPLKKKLLERFTGRNSVTSTEKCYRRNMYLKFGLHDFKMTLMGTILCFTALSGTSAHGRIV
jgi:hypothetical protein